MKNCYVVMRHIPDDVHHATNSCVYALTENLYLAEKLIAGYYASSFGDDGENLVCVLAPKCAYVRTYYMRSHYKEVDGTTYFTVYEEEIKNDSALL